MRKPPTLATELLTRLGPNDPALAGDLLESYRAGRSVLWYWWQVLTSLVIGAGQDLWVDKWLGVHAVATFVGMSVFLRYVWKLLWFQTTLSMRLQEFTVSVWGPQDPLVNAPYRWIFILAMTPVQIMLGWFLAKVHKDHRGAAVMVCCVVGTAINTPRLVTLAGDSASLNLYLHFTSMAAMLIGVVVGAFLAGSREQPGLRGAAKVIREPSSGRE